MGTWHGPAHQTQNTGFVTSSGRISVLEEDPHQPTGPAWHRSRAFRLTPATPTACPGVRREERRSGHRLQASSARSVPTPAPTPPAPGSPRARGGRHRGHGGFFSHAATSAAPGSMWAPPGLLSPAPRAPCPPCSPSTLGGTTPTRTETSGCWMPAPVESSCSPFEPTVHTKCGRVTEAGDSHLRPPHVE